MFPQILGIFFAVFDPEVGPRTRCQVPDGLVISTATSEVAEPLVSFEAVRNYVIPKPVLCNRLISLRVKNVWLVGYPVHIQGEDYARNGFTFNFVFIFPATEGNDPAPFESAITRTARTFKALEEQSHYLSNPKNVYDIDSCVEQMFQDINSFSECQIPIGIGETNKIDIKLFPILEAPPNISPHHVPLTTVKLSSLVDDTWDPAIQRIIPFLNGINNVRRIADLAQADYELTKQCIQHLMHYDCVVIVGTFQFSNIYAPTPDIVSICDPEVYKEFLAFVYHPLSSIAKSMPVQFPHRSSGADSGISPSAITPSSAEQISSSLGSSEGSVAPTSRGSRGSVGMDRRHTAPLMTMADAFKMYSSFQNGLTLYTWYSEHKQHLGDIDVRRFLLFGILKQLIYRVYPWALHEPSRRAIPTTEKIAQVMASHDIEASPENIAMVERCFTRPQNFDYLCTELRVSRTKVSRLLRALGDWNVVNS